ncbi:2'-5' RNA ligase family protein [Streptomyces antimycoticus]|uniref:2'-5' RNA ligase family protein n=1 Tax=Streptomyces antimycoticus TaxID=68175 RepID=UPI00381DB487
MPQLSTDPAAFPAEPPAELDDLAGIAAHDWTAFSALEEMTDHWARPGWADGSRAYYWMLTFPDTPALADLALRCQKELDPLSLDMVPADGLHITLARIGTRDAVPHERLEALTRAAARELPDAFALRVMPLAGSQGAVRFSVGPWTPLVQLHAALAKAGRTEELAPRKPTTVFRPHLSLAYNNRRRSAGPVVDIVASLRTLPPVDIEVTDVQLVELRREGATYRWDVLENLPLTAWNPVEGRGRQ